MSLFVDIHVARIQEYLDRSSKLWERRFASQAVVRASATADLATTFPEFRPNHEAGHQDGYLHLILADDHDPQVVLPAVLTQLRLVLPAAHLDCWWEEAEDYLAAHRAALGRAGSESPSARQGQLTWLPATVELSIIKRCEGCGEAAAAARRYTDPDESSRWLCPDCDQRQRGRLTPWRKTGRPEPNPADDPRRLIVPDRELALLRLVADQLGHPVDTAPDFTQLHPNWNVPEGKPTDDTPTGRGRHLATVHFDGNSFGKIFGGLHDRDARIQLSQAVDQALNDALETATVQLHEERDRRLLVQPHLMGGDDALISVWAPRVWPFVRIFTTTFNQAMNEVCTRLITAGLLPADAATPSISAGIVIAPDSLPFPQTRVLAERGLDAAKSARSGRSAFGWLDTTADGLMAPHRRPVTLEALEAFEEALTRLAGLNKSARASLATAARTGDADQVAAEARRNGLTDVVRPFEDDHVLGIRDALTLTRWWRS